MKQLINYVYTALIIVCTAYFGYQLLLTNRLELLPIPIFVIAVIFQFFSIVFLPFAWHYLLKNHANPNPFMTYRVYSKSWLGRYVPGKVGWVVGRMVYGDKIGISKKILAYTTLFEIALVLLILLLFSVPFIIIYFRSYIYLLMSPLFLILCSILTGFAAAFLNILRRRVNKFISILSFYVSSIINANLIVATALIIISTIFSFIPFIIVLNHYTQLQSYNLLYLFGLHNMSNLIGIVSFFAPAGIGAKEFVLSLGFGKNIELSSILLALLMHRIVLLFSDLMFFFSHHLISYKRGK